MGVAVLLKAQPGAGSSQNLQQVFRSLPGTTAVVQIHGSSYADMENLKGMLEQDPDARLNVVFDLTQVITLANWTDLVVDILKDRNIGNATLPEHTNFAVIVNDNRNEPFNDEPIKALEGVADFVIDGRNPDVFAEVKAAVITPAADGALERSRPSVESSTQDVALDDHKGRSL